MSKYDALWAYVQKDGSPTDQHLVDAADGEGYRAARWVRHLPGRLDGVVQQVPQNRAQIHAADVGAARKLHLPLYVDHSGSGADDVGAGVQYQPAV